MADAPPFVLVGGGVTAFRAAEGLRARGYDGAIVLISAEPDLPYDRPPLSKAILRGEKPPSSAIFRDAAAFSANRIDVRLSTAARALHPNEHMVELANGERLPYARLLVATGTAPRQLAVPGADLPGVFYLRTLHDAEQLAAQLKPGARVVVVGAGFIGAEVAASARQLGLAVTLVEFEPTPLRRALGDEVGAIYAEMHRDEGVRLLTSESVVAFRGRTRVEEAVTASGQVLPCDVAVIGVGVRPAVDWLEGSGVAISNGVDVDAQCRTNVADVFAAGDVANWPYAGERIRVEHWDHASNHGTHAATAMLGSPTPYETTPYFWSDQFRHNLQYVGHARTWERVVFRGNIAQRTFSAFYVAQGVVLAALVVNRPRDLRPSRRLIESRLAVDPAALEDESSDLRRLVTDR